jgi:hypothetical protein
MGIWAKLREIDLLRFVETASRSSVVDAIFDDWFLCFLEER